MGIGINGVDQGEEKENQQMILSQIAQECVEDIGHSNDVAGESIDLDTMFPLRLAEGAVYILRHRADLRRTGSEGMSTLPEAADLADADYVALADHFAPAMRNYGAYVYYRANAENAKQVRLKDEALVLFAKLAGVPVPLGG